jgi:uncharacterized protein with HEPN domain
MSRSDSVYIQDIIESITIIFTYLENKTEQDFINEQIVQDAVIRRFEIIGEASTKISDGVKSDNPGIEWKLMKGMRNKMIHEYFGVSASTVYHTVIINLPLLQEKLKKIVIK